jgi:(p)ppGpp synthase/HD superfamily hydrolase
MGGLSKRFAEALVLAAELHRDQLRKGTEIPYIAHLLSVAGIVLEYGGTEDEAIAALLHDSVEDQGGEVTANAILNRFGQMVFHIVMECSDAVGEPKPPWKDRKEKYLAHVPDTSSSVRLVSAADKLHNARSILRDYRAEGERIWSRFKGDREGTLWYYRSLVSVYRGCWSSPLIDELDQVVRELESLCKNHGDRNRT